MNLSLKIAFNTLIQFTGKIISTILGLIAIALITRYLGQKGFGEYTTIVTFLSFFAIIADMGLTLISSQMLSQANTDKEKIISNLMSFRLVSAIILIVIAPFIVFLFPYDKTIKIGVIITSFSFVFIALNQILTGFFQYKLRTDKISLAEVIGRITLLLGVIIVWKLNLGLRGILLTTVLSSFINFVWLLKETGKFIKLKLDFDWQLWRKLIKKSWPLAVTIILNLLYLKTDTLILSLIKTPEEVGIYGAAYKVIDVLVTLPFMFAGIILPILSRLWAEKKMQQFQKTLQHSFNFMIVLALPLSFGAQIFAKKIMILIAGKNFAASGPVLKILIVASSLIFISCIFAHGVIAIDKQKKVIGAYVFVAITSLIAYIIFIPKYSYFGAAWVTVYSEFAILVASLYIVWRYTKFIPRLHLFLKSLLASLMMFGVLYYFQNINFIILFILGFTLYFISLYLLGVKKEYFTFSHS